MIAAVEDAVSEALVRRLIAEVRPDLTLHQVMRKNGKGYIRSKARALNRTAHSVPVFILVDQDRYDPCPADLIREILPVPHGPRLLFRVAVMEAESWLLADANHLATFLGVSRGHMPAAPDEVSQPKEMIVALAARSQTRAIRDDLVPRPGDLRKVGAAYNPRLISFIENEWDVNAAAAVSPSLRRAVDRLRIAF
jgi:hypothetical protein